MAIVNVKTQANCEAFVAASSSMTAGAGECSSDDTTENTQTLSISLAPFPRGPGSGFLWQNGATLYPCARRVPEPALIAAQTLEPQQTNSESSVAPSLLLQLPPFLPRYAAVGLEGQTNDSGGAQERLERQHHITNTALQEDIATPENLAQVSRNQWMHTSVPMEQEILQGIQEQTRSLEEQLHEASQIISQYLLAVGIRSLREEAAVHLILTADAAEVSTEGTMSEHRTLITAPQHQVAVDAATVVLANSTSRSGDTVYPNYPEEHHPIPVSTNDVTSHSAGAVIPQITSAQDSDESWSGWSEMVRPRFRIRPMSIAHASHDEMN